jgi:hypothetical protein
VVRNVVDLRPRGASRRSSDRRYEWWLAQDGIEIAALGAPSDGAPASQDGWLAFARPAFVRCAVLDGATSPASAATYCGLDAATWAAQVSRASLLADDDIAACLWRANKMLHDPTALRAGARPQAAVVVADIRARWDGDASAQVVRASDCLAFARYGPRWVSLFPGPRLTADAAQVWDAWCDTHPEASEQRRADAEDRALGAPAAWRTAAIGRFAELRLETADADGFDEMLLASAAAGITIDDLERLDDVDQLETFDRHGGTRNHARGDATIVRWRRVDAPNPHHPSRRSRAVR